MNASSPAYQTVRQRQAAARRQQILEAAARLFARQGVARTTTRQIAREVAVTEGLIFKYYPSKLALVRAVMGSPHIILGDLRTMLKNAQDRPVAEVLAEVATTWLDRLHRESDLSAILFGEALINPDIGVVLDDVIGVGSADLVRFLIARQRADQITAAVDTRTIAHMYMASILMFFLRYHRLSERKWKREANRFAQQLQTAWLRMVTP